MIKEFITTFCVIAFLVGCIYYITSHSYPLQYRKEKVIIDSISVENDNAFLPYKTWTYHTKYGPTECSKNNQIFKVGDTIEVKIVKTN